MAIVKKIKAEVVEIINRGDDIFTLDLSLRDKRVKFSPGQFLHLALDEYDPSFGWPESRCFSIQSSPDESRIRLTYSVKGMFTRRMSQELEVGSHVALKLPYGDLFSQQHSREGTVFIAGGTGITPFLSLFTAPAFKDYLRPCLYLGVRTPSHDFYSEELDQACSLNPGLTVKKYFEETDGLISTQSVLDKAEADGCFFISGPPEMIRFFKMSLTENGIDSNCVKTDDWE